ncbi:bile acid:sodium symporter family protein, partial [Bacillus subtilis]|nr:bile acid:sodium symporter family protein [Bacillus subtilis]
VLDVTFFPSHVDDPVEIGMLFQQILAALFCYMLNRFELKQMYQKV